jgi:hypothetical protein
MTKVFVSSTVYDLLDARAEVEAVLREMHLTPVLSESSSADFRVVPDRNSVECCLANLRTSNVVILLLSQRYGPPLPFWEDPTLSATHVEYREARRCGMPIYVYVRDRLEGEFATHKRNPTASIEFRWSGKDATNLFALLKEHSSVVANGSHSNWFSIFRDSLELKQLVRRDLHAVASRSHLESLIHENRVPFVTATCEVDKNTRATSNPFVLHLTLRNCGSAPAYRCKSILRCDDGVFPDEVPFLAPSQESTRIVMRINDGRPWQATLEVVYFMSHGHKVINTYRVGLETPSPVSIHCGASAISQRFVPATQGDLPFLIEDRDTATTIPT